jgi:ELWxxDGT repeat protein
MPHFTPLAARKAFSWLIASPLLLAGLAGDPLMAQPRLLKDINTSPAGSLPDEFVAMNGVLYFTAKGGGGRELYRTDGTAAGTTLVKDITPRFEVPMRGLRNYLTPVNNQLFFRKDDGIVGTELWKSDGTPGGTVLVKDINPGPGGGFADGSQPAVVGNVLYLAAYEATTGLELWKSDGTAAGTVLVRDITPGTAGSDLIDLTAFKGLLYFIRKGPDYRQLWKSDGTAAGTTLVKEIAAGLPSLGSTPLVEANGVLYFGVINGPGLSDALWRSDGTAAGTLKVTDLVTGKPGGATAYTLSTPVNSGGTLYFTDIYRGLFKSDGTAAGTVLVKEFVWPGARADGTRMVPFPGGVYFAAYDAANDTELWKSDGTAAGTVLVKDVNPGSGGSHPNHLTFLNGKLYFDVLGSFSGAERQLWRSDGTAAGTQLVRAIPASASDARFMPWGTFGNHLYFGASDAAHGFELWKTDGTAAGTALVSDIQPGSYGGPLRGFTELNGNLFFAAIEQGAFSDGAATSMLYKTDGTPEGTASVHPVSTAGLSDAYGFVKVSPNLFFYGSQSSLWKSDGTPGGRSLVKSFRFDPTWLTNVNGTLYFVAEDNVYGEELWKTDGTPAGTVLVKDINPGLDYFIHRGLVHLNGLLFLRVDDGTHGLDLWRSDGTAAGTFLLKDFEGNSFPDAPSMPVYYQGAYYFAASDGVRGRELWKTDGTAAGTVLAADIAAGPGGSGPAFLTVNPATNTLYFMADDGVHGRELWRSDGTQTGTALVKDSNPAGGLTVVGQPVTLGAALLFIADDGQHGRELWRTDGTAAGTQLLKDINPGVAGAFYSTYDVLNLDGVLYFSATNGTHGEELWRSDGTTAGTFMVADLLPGPFGAAPGSFYGWGGSLYFVATDAVQGRELWRYDPAALLTVFSTSPLCAGSTLSVPFDAGKQVFNPGNVFTAELSDAGGSFRTPQPVGTLTATSPAAIAVTLPATVPPGSGYRIRVNASSPALSGSDNGTNLTIRALPAAAITVDGPALTATEGTGYRWFLNGAALDQTTRTIQAQQPGSYAVEVTDAAGCTARSAGVDVQVTGLETLPAGQWTAFPNPSGGAVTVAFAGGNWGGAHVRLLDARGTTLHAATLPAGAAGQTLQLDLTRYARGVYLLVVHREGKAAYRKIMKQ